MSHPRSNFESGSMAWLLQRVTAVVLLFTLAFHFILLHFLNHAADVTLWETGVRMDQLSYFLVMLLFLVAGAYHGLNGIYNALLDWGLSGRLRRVTFWLFVAVGTLLIVQGVRVAIAMAGVVGP